MVQHSVVQRNLGSTLPRSSSYTEGQLRCFFTPCLSAISLRWETQSFLHHSGKKPTMSGESRLGVHPLFFIDFVFYFKKLRMGMFSKLPGTLFATLGLLGGGGCFLKIRDLKPKSFLSYFGAVSHTSVTAIIKYRITKRKERREAKRVKGLYFSSILVKMVHDAISCNTALQHTSHQVKTKSLFLSGTLYLQVSKHLAI